MDELTEKYGDVGWAQVWKSWRDAMLAQGREVRPELMDIPIPPRDKELDATIASEVVDDFLTWASAHCNLKLVDAAQLQKATEMLRQLEWSGPAVNVMGSHGRYIKSCPICGAERPEGHTSDCELAALLRELG